MAEPRPKSPGIEDLLFEFTGKDRVSTIRANKCMTCKGDAVDFRDRPSEYEYTISGMCQTCQDEVFGGA